MVNLPTLDNVVPLARLLQNASKNSQIKQFIMQYLKAIVCQSKLLEGFVLELYYTYLFYLSFENKIWTWNDCHVSIRDPIYTYYYKNIIVTLFVKQSKQMMQLAWSWFKSYSMSKNIRKIIDTDLHGLNYFKI